MVGIDSGGRGEALGRVAGAGTASIVDGVLGSCSAAVRQLRRFLRDAAVQETPANRGG